MLCLIFTLLVGINVGIVFVGKFDWQITLYLVLFSTIIIGFWIIMFAKIKKIRILYLILFIIFILSSMFLPSVKKQYDLDYCLDTGNCDVTVKINQD